MPNKTNRTPKKDALFLAGLTKHGRVATAAKTAGYTRSRVYVWRVEDVQFASDWDDALAIYVDTLEAEVDRRAVTGVNKTIYYQGREITTIKEYSDILLIFRLKMLRPEYRDRAALAALLPKPPDTGDQPATVNEATLKQIASSVYGLNLDGE